MNTYHKGFSDGRGPDRIGAVAEMDVDQLKDWLKNGDTTKKIIKRAAGGRIQPVVEPKETLLAQQQQLIDGNRRVQMFPRGERELPVPKGMARVKVKNGDTFHFNPRKIKSSEIIKASNSGTENELLDLGPITKDEAMQRAVVGEQPLAVVERTASGVEARAAAGTDKTAPAQIAALEKTKSPGHIVAVEPAEHTIARRFADGGDVSADDDAFQIAAERMRRSVKPDGGRKEGASTAALDRIGAGVYNMAAGPSRLVDAHMQEYQPGMSVQDMPETMHHLPEVALNLVGGGTSFSQPGSAGIFGGRLAKTADHSALAKAEEMVSNGATREQIWRETGWFKGADNKWRFEIPDESLFVRKGYGAGLEHGAGEAFGRHGPKIEHPDLTEAYPSQFDYLAHDVKIARGADPSGRFMPDGPGRNEEFFYSDKPVLPNLFVEAPTTRQARDIASHELQHAVQGTEGFARGASPDGFAGKLWGETHDRQKLNEMAYEMYRRSAGEVEARNVQSRLKMTPEQRRATPPWETEDVPLDRQIVNGYASGGSADGGAIHMADGGEIPAFDPSQPFEAVSQPAPPQFDPSKPFDVVEATQPAEKPSPTFRQRQHSYREALRAGEQDQPAGQASAGPDLSGEHLTGAELASQWTDVGKGLAKGAPAALSGGILGDIEQPVRQLTKEFGVPQHTWLPTTPEGGYLGPRGLGVMAPAANPREAAGMSIASMVVPGAIGKVANAGSAATRSLARVAEPFTASGQETLAGRVLEARATDANAVRQALDNPASREIVPGSAPTTFQATGDMGLGSLEREVSTKNPAEFMQRRAEQNAARVDGLNDLQPTGNHQEVVNAVRGQLDSIDHMTQTAVDAAMQDAQARAGALGGMHNQETYGNALRTVLHDAEQQARTAERRLWGAVDPDGDLTVNMQPVMQTTNRVYGELSQAAQATLKPVEQQVLGVIQHYQPVEPFREFTDLRSLVSAAMREELSTAGRTPAYARLSRLRGGLEDSISSAVGNRAVADAVNLASGRISSDQTLGASLQREVARWRESRAGQEAATGAGTAIQSGRTPPVRQGLGNEGAARRGLGDAAGDQGIQGTAPVTANFDQAAAGRLSAATDATRERAQTFSAEPLKGILRREGQNGPFRLRETAVPGKVFHPGDSGFEDVTRFRQAVGDAEALPVIRDYAASSVREAALTPEGTIDPARFSRWRAQHAEAIRALPELEAELADAAAATRTVGDMNALRRASMQEAQEGILGKILKVSEPKDITSTVGGLFSGPRSVAETRRLVAQVERDPAAMEGLRKAAADFITDKFVSNTEAATSGRSLIKADQFQTFIKNNETSLGLIFRPEEVAAMRAIAADIQRANRSVTAVKLPGQSNTAQDLSAISRNASGPSWLSKITTDAGAYFGTLAVSSNPVVAGTAAGAAHIANAIRSAGFTKVDDLVKGAMLNPDLARTLLAKVPAQNAQQVSKSLARRLVTLTAADASASQLVGHRQTDDQGKRRKAP